MISGLQFSGPRTLKFLRLQSEVTEKTNQIEVMRIARVSDFSSLILFHFIFSSPSFFLFSLSFYFLNISTFHFISSPPLPSPSLPPLSPPLSLPPLPSSRPRPLLPSPPLPSPSFTSIKVADTAALQSTVQSLQVELEEASKKNTQLTLADVSTRTFICVY